MRSKAMTSILQQAHDLHDSLVQWRRDLHQHPELGFLETRTAGRVADHLRGLGIEVATGIGKTGVVGIIEGSSPGPTVLLRFDMDALPIQELNDLPYASQHAGVMHACGHDGHTAIGMGVAQLLAMNRQHLHGRVKLLFQPAEEGLGGALATIGDGVLEHPRPDVAFGLHLWNQFPSGMIYAQVGPLMAAADRFYIEIEGRGGHGGQPHLTVDAIWIAAQVATALHTLVSRNVPPHEAAVLSIGSFHGGSAFNVIAERVEMSGTFRTFSPEVRQMLIRRSEEVVAGICQAHGARYRFRMDDFFTPAVINEAQAAALMQKTATALFGSSRLDEMTPIMVAEDMAELLNRVPGCFVLVGARPPHDAGVGPHHNPRFNIDEAVLSDAAALLAQVTIDYLTG